MNTPDITKAQIAALLQAIIAVLVAFGIHLTTNQQTALLGLSGALAAALTLGDAIIRHGRARALQPSPIIPGFNTPAPKTTEPLTPPAGDPAAPTPAAPAGALPPAATNT